MKTPLALFFFAVFVVHLSAQNLGGLKYAYGNYTNQQKSWVDTIHDETLPSNSIYITGATIVILSTGDITYERIHPSKNNSMKYNGFSIAAGGYFLFLPSVTSGSAPDKYYGIYAAPSYVHLIGKENRYFEFSLGVIAGNEFSGGLNPSNFILLPNAGLGYRKIIWNNKGLFRVGFSLAKGLYLSLGVTY